MFGLNIALCWSVCVCVCVFIEPTQEKINKSWRQVCWILLFVLPYSYFDRTSLSGVFISIYNHIFLSLSIIFSQHHQSDSFRFCVLLFVCLCCYHFCILCIFITDLICCVKELLLCSLLFVCLFVFACHILLLNCNTLFVVSVVVCFFLSSFFLYSLIGTPLYDLLGLLLFPSDVLVCFVCLFVCCFYQKDRSFPGRDGFSLKMFHRRLCLNFTLYLWLERFDLPTYL